MQRDEGLVVGVGETLWDMLPTGKQLGGAPINVAIHLGQLGQRSAALSRLGTDALGQEALAALKQYPIDTSPIQLDDNHATGTVQVKFDKSGAHDFVITSDVAWDYLEWNSRVEQLAKEAAAVCYGTLAQRSPRSRATIQRFLTTTRPDCLRVYDVNLRQQYYTKESIRQSLALARVVKVNDEEWETLRKLLQLGALEQLLTTYEVELLCITKGPAGCRLVTQNADLELPGGPSQPVDTVGAGDAFTAVLLYHLLRGSSLERAGTAAIDLSDYLVTQPGATPTLPRELVVKVTQE